MGSPDLPRYITWAAVPHGLHTRNQLAQMDPPRRPAKDAPPVGQALYHGNKYAPLWPLDATVEKRRPSDAQKAALRRASAARHICQRCDARTHPSATPDNPPTANVDPWTGRLCDVCSNVLHAHRQHCDYQRQAGRTMTRMAGRGAIVVQADNRDEPRRLAMVEFSNPAEPDDGHVLVDFTLTVPGVEPQPGEVSYVDAFALVDSLMSGRDDPLPVFVGWKHTLWPLVVLANGLDEAGQERRREEEDRERPFGAARWSPWDAVSGCAWMTQKWNDWQEATPPSGQGTQQLRTGILLAVTVRSLWGYYHAEPSSPDPRFYHPAYSDEMLGRTGDVVADARLVIRTLAGMADGTAPVSPKAPWLAHPPTVSGYDGV